MHNSLCSFINCFHELGERHLPQLASIHARLQAVPPARIADLGCGMGWSTISMALAYPSVRVDGFDIDALSIEDAWANAHQHGLADRVTFHVRDGGDPVLNGRYDLITAFVCIHEHNNPGGVLATMRRLAGEQGAVLVMGKQVDATLRRYALEVGFRDVQGLPIDYFLFRFYRLYT